MRMGVKGIVHRPLGFEVGQGQDEAVAQLWRDAGLIAVSITSDLAGIGRVVSGNKL